MSRSYRKTPICGNGSAKSEKWEKRYINKRLRLRTRDALRKSGDLYPLKNEVKTLWDMAKDGKFYFDKTKHPKLMRK